MGLAKMKAGIQTAPRQAVAFAEVKTKFSKMQSLKSRFSKGEVQDSEDLQRVLALPRRSKPELARLVQELTARLKKPEGTQTLREVQAWALDEAPRAGGLVGLIQTGGGKTLPLMLMPMVFPHVQNVDGTTRPIRAICFVPPSLKAQFLNDYESYGKHWKLPNLAGGRWFTPGLPVLHVVAYSELSHTKSSALLLQIDPDLVMGDEISSLRNFETSRTRRVRAFFGASPNSKFIGMDATIVSDSVEDFWAPLIWALGGNAPVPTQQIEMKKWARAIDPESFDDGYFMPGALMKLCGLGESVRKGFQRRLVDTEGIVSTKENALGIPLHFNVRVPPPMPQVLQDHLKNLRRKPGDGGWVRPDGEVLREMPEVAACAEQLAQGLYLFWFFPRAEPDEVIDEWLLRRQNWNRELRSKLGSPGLYMDSPKLCENAAARWFNGGCTGCTRGAQQEHAEGCRDQDTHPLWESYSYLPWMKVKNTVVYESRVKWESDWLLRDAAAWALETPGIVWVNHPEFGHQLSKMTGLKYYGGGDEANTEIAQVFVEENGLAKQSIICSIASNKKGRNLQYSFSRNLIVSFPASNETVEQLVGRTLREGQTAKVVTCDYYQHTPELKRAFEKATSRAEFVGETLGQDQKLITGIYE